MVWASDRLYWRYLLHIHPCTFTYPQTVICVAGKEVSLSMIGSVYATSFLRSIHKSLCLLEYFRYSGKNLPNEKSLLAAASESYRRFLHQSKVHVFRLRFFFLSLEREHQYRCDWSKYNLQSDCPASVSIIIITSQFLGASTLNRRRKVVLI